MSVLSTLRQGTYSVAETWRVANGQLAHVHRARPASIGDVPAAFVGDISTTLRHDSGTRTWTGSVELVIVDNIAVNEETADRLDTIAAALLDQYSDQPHIFGDNTVAEPIGAESLSVEVGDTIYSGRVITIGRFMFVEGR